MRGGDWREDRPRGNGMETSQRADVVGMLFGRNRSKQVGPMRTQMGPMQAGMAACGVVAARSTLATGRPAHANFVIPPRKRGEAAAGEE